jgi:hypothetical protein
MTVLPVFPGDRFRFLISVSAGWRIQRSLHEFLQRWLDSKDPCFLRVVVNQLLGNNFYPYVLRENRPINVILNSGFSRLRPPGLVSPFLTWERVVSKKPGS